MKRINVPKSKDHRLYEAVEALNKVMAMEDPHIRITSPSNIFPHGIFGCSAEDAKEFGRAIKTFVEAYKKYYRLEKVRLELHP